MKDHYTKFYKTNGWRDNESRSGPGSTVRYTENLRMELPKLISQFEIKSILDAPCGDFNWMQHVVPNLQDIDYTGADIVDEIVKDNNKKYANNDVKFISLDVTKDKLPLVDLMICRDCLFHFSNRSIINTLNNFVNSNIKYLLTTTFINEEQFKNRDCAEGSFRKIDLFIQPYSFLRSEVLYTINDWIEPFPPRNLVLFSREHIKNKMNK
jgi:hypothetical protein